jgi:hypothetical protein
MANKISRGTRTKCSAFGTYLGSIVRLNSDNFNAFSFSFVLDKTLQLKETPIANPIVHSLSSSLFSDTFEVFHDYLVSVEFGNNVFTDVMINPSHPTSFLSRDFAKQSLTGFCAFGLKNRTQVFEFSFALLDFGRIIKLAVGSDCQVIYSEVNAENLILQVRRFGSNLFRECEQKETSAFCVNSQQAFIDFPVSEVIPIDRRDVKVEGFSFMYCPDSQDIAFEIGTSGEIISNRCSLDNWFGFSFLDKSTGLTYASDSKLRRQSLSDVFVDKMMQLDVIPDFVLPCNINTELQGFGVCFDSSNYFSGCGNLDFSCCSDLHNGKENSGLYKLFGGNARNDGTQFIPTLKGLGILATII